MKFDFKDLMAFADIYVFDLSLTYIEKPPLNFGRATRWHFLNSHKVNPPCGWFFLFVSTIYHIPINISRMLLYFYSSAEYFLSISRFSFEER